MHSAADGGHLEVVAFLISQQANIEARDDVSACHSCAVLPRTVYDLCLYVQEGHTPLHSAARKGHKDVVSYLITQRANIEALANVGRVDLQLLFLLFLFCRMNVHHCTLELNTATQRLSQSS